MINLVTGVVFIAGNPIGGPIEYLSNLSFQIKMLLVLIAGINVLVFYFAASHAESIRCRARRTAGRRKARGCALYRRVARGDLLRPHDMYNDTLLYALGL